MFGFEAIPTLSNQVSKYATVVASPGVLTYCSLVQYLGIVSKSWHHVSSNLIPRPLPDFISQLCRKIGFSPQLRDKSASGLGTTLA